MLQMQFIANVYKLHSVLVCCILVLVSTIMLIP